MAINQPGIIPQPWGSSGTYAVIPAAPAEKGRASWAQGFPEETALPRSAGGVPPHRLDFQGVLHALSEHAVFQQSGGTYAWSPDLDYPAGACVAGSDGVVRWALQASGPGTSAGAKDPAAGANPSFWAAQPSPDGVSIVAGAGGEWSAADLSAAFAEAGATAAQRTLADRFADVVNVRDFGAKGDGADDTQALQAAFSSGKSIFFPQGLYRAKQTLYVSNNGASNIRSFYGAYCNISPATGAGAMPCIVFDDDTVSTGIVVQSTACTFENLAFKGATAASMSTSTGILFQKAAGQQTDDTDGYVRHCYFENLLVAVEHVGRALTATDNLFVTVCIAAKLSWPSDADYQGSSAQTPPYANRAVRITGNRKHGVNAVTGQTPSSYLVWNHGDILRSALIADNVCDIGSGILYDEKGIDSCIIRGNIVDVGTRLPLHLLGVVYNSIITHNELSYRYSKVPNTVDVDNQANCIVAQCSDIDGLEISGNLMQGWGNRAIQLVKPSGASAVTYKNISVLDNIFDVSAISSSNAASCVRTDSDIDGFTFSGNTITGTSALLQCLYISSGTTSHANVYGNINVGAYQLCNDLSGFADPIFIQQSGKRACVLTRNVDGILNVECKASDADPTVPLNSRLIELYNPLANQTRIEAQDKTHVMAAVFGSSDSTPNFFAQCHAKSAASTPIHPNLGRGTDPWGTVFADSGTINTSDERLKTSMLPVDEALMKAWGKVEFVQFQFKASVAEKGDAARVHVGLIAQRIKDAFESEGLDAFRYGLLCHDEWSDVWEDRPSVAEETAVDEETGEAIPMRRETVERVLARPAGDRYSLRYEECLALECAYQRWRLERIERQVADLQARQD